MQVHKMPELNGILRDKKGLLCLGVLILIIIFVEVLLFNQGFVFGSLSRLVELHFSINNGSLNQFNLENGKLVAQNDDPNITFNNINIPIDYITIKCKNSIHGALGQVFYRKSNESFNETNSVHYNASLPEETLLVNQIFGFPKAVTVSSLRFDLTNIPGDIISCSEFVINPHIPFELSTVRVAIYAGFLLLSIILIFLNRKPTIYPKMVLIVLLFVFIGSSAFFALKLKEGIIPDEPHHFIVSKFFAATWGIPSDSLETIPYGIINHWPFLSYWINARILNLLSWVTPTLSDSALLIILRLVNVIFSTITVLYSYLFAREIIKNRWGQVFVVFLLTTTLMFVFLCGGDNYDNLMNLCCFAGIYYLICVFKGKPFYKNSILWLISMMIGSLVKITMLPFAAVTGLLWLVYILKQRRTINFKFKMDLIAIITLLILTALFTINVSIYGVNIIKYRSLVPTCIQEFTASQCMAYPQFVRDLNSEKNLSLSEVVSGGYPDPIEYGLDSWIPLMLQRIYGIMGHQIYFPDVIITFHRLLILWTILITTRYWKKPSYVIAGSYVILLFYLLVLFQSSYSTEMGFGFIHTGIQGRYFFPVIGIYYTMMVYYFFEIPSPFFRRLTLLFATILFVYGSPIVFLLRFFSSKFAYWFM